MKPAALTLSLILIVPPLMLVSALANPPSVEHVTGNMGAILKNGLTPPGSEYYPSLEDTGLGANNKPKGPVVEIEGAGVKKIPLVPGAVTQSKIHGHIVPEIEP